LIQNLDELERLLKILRSNGVYTFKWNGLELLISEPSQFEVPSDLTGTIPNFPDQETLDAVVGMPVGDIDDPFLNYNENQVVKNEDQQG